MATRRLSLLRENQCRAAARTVLKKFHVCSAKDIEVETIAWMHSRLKVRIGGLTGSEGRLVANNRGGIIRVASKHNLGRFRFTVAHEIGHYLLHPREVVDRIVSKADLTVWNDATEECEANTFAAEFLMPKEFIQPYCRGAPTIAKLEHVADLFQTSLTATAFQYHEYTSEPVAIVLSEGWRMKSFLPFGNEELPRIRFGAVSPNSAAGERLAGSDLDSGKMVRVPANAWLEGFDNRPEINIWEESRYLEYYNKTLTLLWIDEDLESDDFD
jgi:hypothetical protein